MEDLVNNNKRSRGDDFDEVPESPEAKRLREDLLLDMLDDDGDSGLDMLDDDGDSGDRNPEIQDLASVMKSFEEEIGLPVVEPPPEAADVVVAEAGQPDLGFLLEASDDELGLPPTVPSSSEDGGEVEVAGGDADEGGFGGQIWGFDDDFFGGGMGFVSRPDAGGEDGVLFDEGLFDYSDVVSGPSDLGDFTWRQESLPAV